MADRQDPVQRAGDGRDLYDVAAWENRTLLDRVSAAVYVGGLTIARVVVVLLAVLIIGVQVASLVLSGVTDAYVAASVALSVVPALGLAAFVWKSDVTTPEPLTLLVATFLLGVLFAGFAAVLNSLLQPAFGGFGAVGLVLFFFLVVGPVEETVKLLAVRLYAYRDARFDAVVDGAVYGAVAGLGFATIENGIYIGRGYLMASGTEAVLFNTLQTTAARTLAGPGHVIYSAFAGYYLGLAKFNPEHRGPIVVKGLLVAAFIHGTYNTLAGVLPGVAGVVPLLSGLAAGQAQAVVFVAFVVVYDGVFGYLLYRKLARYRATYTDLDAGRYDAPDESPADGAGESPADVSEETAHDAAADEGRRLTDTAPRDDE